MSKVNVSPIPPPMTPHLKGEDPRTFKVGKKDLDISVFEFPTSTLFPDKGIARGVPITSDSTVFVFAEAH